MKLYIKQKVFSWRDRFTVKDDYGHDKYYVEGEFFSWGKKLHVYDMQGGEVAYIEQKLLTLMPRFRVYRNGEMYCEIKQEFSFFKPRFSVLGTDLKVCGDVLGHNYEVNNGSGECVVAISKEWLTWGDSYMLDISPDACEVTALALVLAIDCVLDSQQN